MRFATSRGERGYTEHSYPDGCYLIFGSESGGIPMEILSRYRDDCVRIPMRPEARCLNLSNSAAVLCYAVQAFFSFSVCLVAPMFWVVLGLSFRE